MTKNVTLKSKKIKVGEAEVSAIEGGYGGVFVYVGEHRMWVYFGANNRRAFESFETYGAQAFSTG